MHDEVGTLFDGEPLSRCENYINKEASVWEVFIDKVEPKGLETYFKN